ncbi:hypothetical protein BE21_27095 [Sorangium cellulosum]|uniref:Cytochrome c domain-containing protein n=1 Tax=Sorangium cellulosum TaxID=56 RepID=A0A150TT42_SORCE|nr:hypothetical protein BE21_27095 [Sorangium cellulosum]
MAVLHPAVTLFRPLPGEVHPTPAPPAPSPGLLRSGLLPVDIAISPDGSRGAIAMAGSHEVIEMPLEQLGRTEASDCDPPSDIDQLDVWVHDYPIAVGYDAASNLLVQLQEPPSLLRFEAVSGELLDTVLLPGERRYDWGHTVFHGRNNGVAEAVVCASCHPEGQDDGRSWSFNPTGLRRTQSLAGGVLDTAPLHWDGDLKTFRAFLREVFVKRMGESHPSPEGVAAFASWLDAIKPVPLSKPADQGAVRRGEALFNDATVGCASCHSGETLTNDQTVDVGTGKAFQVPSLRGLAARAPYMHDGCAATLRDRFGPCGGGDKHGVTSTLTPAQIDDLVAYLETL